MIMTLDECHGTLLMVGGSDNGLVASGRSVLPLRHSDSTNNLLAVFQRVTTQYNNYEQAWIAIMK